MNKLTRTIAYWLLLVLSLASGAVGTWLISDQSTTMTNALLAGTATGVEVYVGQSLIVTGAVLLGAGIVGLLLALALAAAKALLPTVAPAVVAPIDWTTEPVDAEDDAPAEETVAASVTDASVADEAATEAEDELATR